MKIRKIFLIILTILLITSGSYAQDRRTLDTKIADLISQFPAGSTADLEKLMNEMLILGPEGWTGVCSQIQPPGSGDDTQQRFAVESFSRYLSSTKSEDARQEWEKVCITFVAAAGDNTVRDFFIKQLQLVGSDKTAEAMKRYISDMTSCSSAITALGDIAGPADQLELIKLIAVTENGSQINNLQSALINAANQENDPEERSSIILEAIVDITEKEKFIPVLAKTGGTKALAFVLDMFENGDQKMREVIFNALISWRDNSASTALFEICASGNKSYEGPAFNGYMRQVSTAPVSDEQKLLLYRKIMPYAFSADRKNQILTRIGKLKIYPAFFFVARYLDDDETSAAAAKAAMYIALPSVSSGKGMEGDIVREILYKVLDKLSGPEAEYDKEMLSKYIASMPDGEGFVKIFNGFDLTGWQGLVENPVVRARMKPEELARKQAEADKKLALNWSVKDECIIFSGEGDNLCSVKEYGNFELLVDWKISKGGDSGIYLRGSPQVQIWDIQRTDSGVEIGSGGLYNNEKNISNPLKVADNPAGEWNSFRILMIGEKVSVWLNGELVVDDVTMENYWDRSIPIFPKGPVELQAHGTDLAFRDIYIREIPERI
ncbi:MAG TPA: DUF1080 domain-containing protein [Bacteroidales bacterium]|nr:DUF1080 domain-containing protein [Bacteroidales bacterium]HQB37087.1 DUF1080 domain-containing protein [Bacteroidales bacterium]